MFRDPVRFEASWAMRAQLDVVLDRGRHVYNSDLDLRVFGRLLVATPVLRVIADRPGSLPFV